MSSTSHMNLFPSPHIVSYEEEELHVTKNFCIFLRDNASDIENVAATNLSKFLKCPVATGVSKAGSIYLGIKANVTHSQGYILDVKSDRITILGNDPAGVFYGAETLKQIIEEKGFNVPILHIEDWPDLRYRGLYIEDKWGPDLMSLDEWKELIDVMASLKLNFMGIGIYGCWGIQYDNQILEFVMVPFKSHPELKTPKKISFYSPTRAGSKTISYLPPMFVEDFLGELIAYGKRRNVIVRPQFNSLGHNTLIPKLHPEVSAKDESGHPTGYGFCLSHPSTYEILFSLYDEIIDKYLKPNSIDFFHVGMDEIYPRIGVDTEHPKREVDPWCKCSKCKSKPRGELLLNYLFKIIKHLVSKGINNISIWNDQLHRMNLLEEFSSQLKAKGLKEKVIVEWWHYGLRPFKNIKPELGLNRWVNPMTGYYFWTTYKSYLKNIQLMLDLGYAQGAEGVECYGVYDPAYHRNYLYLSDYAWNKTAGDLDEFKSKYSKLFSGMNFEAFDKIAKLNSLETFMNSLEHYWYTYVSSEKPYPRDYLGECLEKLKADPESKTKLKQIWDLARKSERKFEKHRNNVRPELLIILDNYIVESLKIETMAKELQMFLNDEDINKILKVHDNLMKEMERIKTPYLLPQIMRELTAIRDAFLKVR